MVEPIENMYFNWLYAKVADRHTNNYHALLRILYTTEFIIVINFDKHRAEDGKDLRLDFLREANIDGDRTWVNEPCSIFELFIAFAQRASFQTDIPVKDWFWIFMTNLKLDDYTRVQPPDKQVIDDILYEFNWRLYTPDGRGNIFPMLKSKNDQRLIELWYQLAEYLEDLGLY